MSRMGISKGGMRSSSLFNTNYCPVCEKELDCIGYPRIGIYSHMTRKGNILLCDINTNLKRKKIKSKDFDKIKEQIHEFYDSDKIEFVLDF